MLKAISFWFHVLFAIGPDDSIIWPVKAWKIARAIYPPPGVAPLSEQEIHDKFFA